MAFLLSILANFLFHIMLQMPYISSLSSFPSPPTHLRVGLTLSAEDMLALALPPALAFGIATYDSEISLSAQILLRLLRFQNWSLGARESCNFCKSNERTIEAATRRPSSNLLTWCFSTSAAVKLEFMSRNDGEEGAKKCRV